MPPTSAERITKVLREPSARFWYNWSPQLIRSAEISANSGNLRLAADLCEWMFGDDRVMAVSDTRSDALLGLPFGLIPQGDGRKSGAVATSLAEEWDDAYPDAELKKLHKWGIALGVGLGRQTWVEREDDGLLVPRLDVWSPRWLSHDQNEGQWYVEVVASESGFATTKIPITPGDGEWILYLPYGASRPWVNGAYRALARWCLLKEYARLDWGGYSERLGQGVWVTEIEATPNVGFGTNVQRQELASDLQGIGRNTAVALNPGEHLKLIESVARQQDNFKLQIDTADNGIAVSWLGQNLTTQAGTGTMGAASLHGRVLHGRTRMDGKTLPATLRSQSTAYFAEFNFGDRRLAPKPWWDTTSIDDRQARAAHEQMTAQADGGLVAAGIMTPNEARAKRGLPPIPGGDVLRGGAPPPEPAKAPVEPANEPEPDAEPEPKGLDDEDEERSEIYGYHLEYGVVSRNEARRRLGLPPRDGHDELVSLRDSSVEQPTQPSVDSPPAPTTPAPAE